MHRTTVANDSNQSHETSRLAVDANRQNNDSNRSTPDLIKESAQYAGTSQSVAKQALCEVGDQGEKKAAATRTSKDTKLNELTMKQIETMSRTRVKSTMMNTKTDAKVSRPSLNQLKLSQQQMAYASVNQQVTAGTSMIGSNSYPQNTLSEKMQANEPGKTEQWMMRQPDSTTVCTSIDSGYILASKIPATTVTPYTTHPNQVSSVTHPGQYTATHLPVTCGTQSSMSVMAAHESGPSTSFATGQTVNMNDPWYTGSSMK